MKPFHSCVMLCAVVASAATASAQSIAGSSPGGARVNLVSANPIGLLFEWYNGEVEHALGSTASVAAAASSIPDIDSDNSRYSAGDVIFRYYPAARAVRGFSIGASAGLVNYNDANSCDYTGCVDESGTSGAIGVRGDYVWTMGRDQHFAVAVGIGAKRIIGKDIGTEGLPIGRLSIGYAW